MKKQGRYDISALQAEAEASHGLPKGLLGAVARVESAGNPNAVSPAGARGLYQFMPGTARDLGIDPFDPVAATGGAARYLSSLIERYDGDIEKALAAYNWGVGNVDRKGLDKAPAETRAYVPRVLAALGREPPPSRNPVNATRAPARNPFMESAGAVGLLGGSAGGLLGYPAQNLPAEVARVPFQGLDLSDPVIWSLLAPILGLQDPRMASSMRG